MPIPFASSLIFFSPLYEAYAFFLAGEHLEAYSATSTKIAIYIYMVCLCIKASPPSHHFTHSLQHDEVV